MITEIIFSAVSTFSIAPHDSLGIEKINGQICVVHKVEDKETLYSLSRRYGTTVEEIIRYNETITNQTLEIGQIVKVPYATREKNTASTSGKRHTVAEKETLYAISRMYNVSVDDLKRWNNLDNEALRVGQILIVSASSPAEKTTEMATPETAGNGLHTVAAKETLFSLSRQYGVTVDQIKQWNNLSSNDLQIGQVIKVAPGQTVSPPRSTPDPVVVADAPRTEEKEKVVSQDVQPASTRPQSPTSSAGTIRISESVRNSDEIVEKGVAELIEGTDGNRKYLALHRSAPAGTILKVRNEMNNREVFVRVMGKLPDNALNEKLLLKISKSAYDRLGAIDPRFRVEVTYYK